MGAGMSLKNMSLSVLTALEKDTCLPSLDGFREELARLKERMQDDVFRIAVVGEFSSGKSTFINALLGKDVLSHASKETTAVLTQIVNVSPDDPRVGTGLVRRKDGTEQEICMDELREYTTTMSARHAVAQEIASVDIYTPLLHAERPLMLIDTPGLNGVASGHLDQTIRVVQEAHACIYLLQLRGLTKEDLAFLRDYLMPNQQNFIFVQNFIDAFNPMEGERVEQRLPLLEKTLREEVFAESKHHTFDVCGVSALKELAGRDHALTRIYQDSVEELDEAARVRLREESHFADFRALMAEKFDESRLDEIQYSGTANAVLQWAKGLLIRIDMRTAEASEIYESSRERQAAEKLERIKQRLIASRAERLQAMEGYIGRELRETKEDVRRALKDAAERIEGEIRSQLAACRRPEEMQQVKDGIPNMMESRFKGAQQSILEETEISIRLLHRKLVERVEAYSGIGGVTGVVQTLGMDELPVMQTMKQENGHIRERELQLAELRAQEENLVRQLAKDRQAVAAAQRDVQCRVREEDDAVRAWRAVHKKMCDMGDRPVPIMREQEVAVERDIPIIGPILDLISTKMEIRLIADDSEGEDWDDAYRELQVEQNNRLIHHDKIRKDKAKYEQILQHYQQNAAANERKIRDLEARIRASEEALHQERLLDEAARKHAMQEYLRQWGKRLGDRVRTYLSSVVGEDGESEGLLAAWGACLGRVQQEMQETAHRMYDEAEKRKIAQLDAAKEAQLPALMHEIQELTRAQELLKQSIGQMEGMAS